MKFHFYILISLILISGSKLGAQVYKQGDLEGVFSGRISRLNSTAKLMRVKITFENSKFLTRNNRIEFWSESAPGSKCIGYLKGRTSDYLLLTIPDYSDCVRKVHFSVGTYLHMLSEDLEKNLKTATELVDILHKKKMAIDARAQRYQKQINGHLEKVDLVNRRYEVLKQKLELEWQKEISNLEDDKIKIYSQFKKAKSQLNDIDFKLQQYRIRDENLVEDRWSLDTNLYYKK